MTVCTYMHLVALTVIIYVKKQKTRSKRWLMIVLVEAKLKYTD